MKTQKVQTPFPSPEVTETRGYVTTIINKRTNKQLTGVGSRSGYRDKIKGNLLMVIVGVGSEVAPQTLNTSLVTG